MEPSVEVFQPSRLYLRAGWAALSGSLACALIGLRVPLIYFPSGLFAIAGAVLFWLACRPAIRICPTQFNVGDRAIAWREVREINSGMASPLIIKLKLTNARERLIVFPGDSDGIAKLMYQFRRYSYLATFDGVAYRDFWTWSTLHGAERDKPVLEQPVRMISTDEEDEIERMFQKLKAVGRLDVRSDDSKPGGN